MSAVGFDPVPKRRMNHLAALPSLALRLVRNAGYKRILRHSRSRQLGHNDHQGDNGARDGGHLDECPNKHGI